MSQALGRSRAAQAGFSRLARARAPVLFLDLDGTLAPLVVHAENARVPPATRRILGQLRRTGARVVLVSGRSIAGVRHVALMKTDAILGDHGALIWRGRGPEQWLPADRVELARVVRCVGPELERLPGVRLEHKDRSLAIHLRIARSNRKAVIAKVVRLLKQTGLRVLRGRRVIDGQLPGVDKGRAVKRWLAANEAADAVVYAGDDTTDEDAFRALRGRGMTISVGPRTRGADFRTRDPQSFATWLGRLARARRAAR